VKHYYPEVFAAALLNSQPMGFYAPAQLVRDAREHGVEVRPPDINASDWDCTLEPNAGNRWERAAPMAQSSPAPEDERHRNGALPAMSFVQEEPHPEARCALRLGLRQVTGLAETEARRLVERRTEPYRDPADLWRRSGLSKRHILALARADAFASLGLSRRDVLWAVRGLSDAPLPLLDKSSRVRDLEPAVSLPALTLGEQVVDDYAAISMSLRSHPMALLRPRFSERDVSPTAVLATSSNGDRFTLAGLVLVRQRPGTASGVVFVTIEDEHGIANLVVWPKVFEDHRRVVMGSRLLGVQGRVQREGLVIHLVAERLWDWSAELDSISDIDTFHLDHGRGDQVRTDSPDHRVRPPVPVPEANATRHRVGKGQAAQPGYDRSRIALDRPKIKIASRDFH
jgi:error-prone DNA polymerase